ncbi:hypothetical protein J6590_002962 [Homalodisca vitripennis]|nr:hypothetical protein J6590_002960 [Homalodisca vitripennis]KAG8298993.1 hypothetical protein J6590_002962 [Homalodisca vitripennis]
MDLLVACEGLEDSERILLRGENQHRTIKLSRASEISGRWDVAGRQVGSCHLPSAPRVHVPQMDGTMEGSALTYAAGPTLL